MRNMSLAMDDGLSEGFGHTLMTSIPFALSKWYKPQWIRTSTV